MSKSGAWAMLLATSLTGSACLPCEGWYVDRLTVSATFRPAPGAAWTAAREIEERDHPNYGRLAAFWPSAVHDASAVTPGVGSFGVESSSPLLLFQLSAPFPLSVGQVLPVVTGPETELVGWGFTPAADATVTRYPENAAGLWYLDAELGVCSREMPDACEPERELKRRQMASGTLLVTSIRPLQLQIDAVVTYPAESGWAPTRLSGPITLTAHEGSYCFEQD